MKRRWYLIDDDGCRRIDVSNKTWDFFSDFRTSDGRQTVWPAFTQAAIRADLDETVAHIHRVADEYDLECREVTDSPERWRTAVCLATDGELTLVAEPAVDIDERFIQPETTTRLVESMEVDGTLFGRSPAADTLFLTVFSSGHLDFSWSDSLQPGPSRAITFHDDGTATDEDPRRFALNRLGHPPTSPFLDRYGFVEHELTAFGLDDIQPDLANRPIAAALQVGPKRTRKLG